MDRTPPLPRRAFLAHAGVALGAAALAPGALAARALRAEPRPFPISLAQWSLHRRLRSGELDPLGFAAFAREEFGLRAVEYVNQFFADKATDLDYLAQMKQRAQDAGVTSLLIMIDGEGELAHADEDARRDAIDRHVKWIVAARLLGCRAIRVNAAGSGGRDEQRDRAADSLVRLARFGDDYGIDVLVENHGGLSSDGAWLAEVMRAADHPRVGTLPDFGNFRIGGGLLGEEWYDRYLGVAQLMPFAKAVSAKAHDFDARGREIHTDFPRMLGIVLDAGYTGHVGIEYEGSALGELEGVHATLRLLSAIAEGHIDESGAPID